MGWTTGTLLAWVLDDEGRTRRLRSLLYPVALTAVLVVAAVAAALLVAVMVAPLAGLAAGGALTISVTALCLRRGGRTGEDEPPGPASVEISQG